jgi:hypothetical protein
MHFAVCDFVLDIVQNSIEAGARSVALDFFQSASELTVRIVDDGKGMSADELARVEDPFYTDGTKHGRRKVGLGIPFLIQAVEACGGSREIRSVPGKGTDFSFGFDLSNVDAPPVGDVPGLFLSAIAFDGGYEMTIRRKNSDGARSTEYTVRRSEVIDAVGDLNEAWALSQVRAFFESQEADCLSGNRTN